MGLTAPDEATPAENPAPAGPKESQEGVAINDCQCRPRLCSSGAVKPISRWPGAAQELHSSQMMASMAAQSRILASCEAFQRLEAARHQFGTLRQGGCLIRGDT